MPLKLRVKPVSGSSCQIIILVRALASLSTNGAGSFITDLRTPTPFTFTDVYLVTNCAASPTTVTNTLTAYVSHTSYVCNPVTYEFSQNSFSMTNSHIFSSLLMTMFQPGDLIPYVWHGMYLCLSPVARVYAERPCRDSYVRVPQLLVACLISSFSVPQSISLTLPIGTGPGSFTTTVTSTVTSTVSVSTTSAPTSSKSLSSGAIGGIVGGVIGGIIALMALGGLLYLKARKCGHTGRDGTSVFEGRDADTAAEDTGMAENQVLMAAPQRVGDKMNPSGRLEGD